jgi:homoserine dehydrogenase
MSEKQLNIAIAGLGTVGVGVVKILQNQSDILAKRTGKRINIVAVSARSKKERGVNLDDIKWYDNAVDIANDANVDTVVELIGGDSGTAYDLCMKSIANGKNFITANKALIARHGKKISELAEQHNVNVAFEAAVAGGIPVIKVLKEGLAGNEISKVSGILNGTCNYMLTQMKEKGSDFAIVLKEAQDLGYAEADPSFDVGGIDAAHKLAILTSLAFGTEVDFASIYIEGIEKISLIDVKYADELGYKIKLLGLCSKTDKGINQRVCPCLVLKKYPVAGVDGVENAVFFEGGSVGKLVLQGPGAGQGATASAVLADICDIASERFSYMFNVPSALLKKAAFVDMSEHEGRYYIRVTAEDKSGVLAAVSDVLRDEGISVDSILQKSVIEGENAHIIVMTHKTSEQSIIKAVAKIAKEASVVENPNVIRIEL